MAALDEVEIPKLLFDEGAAPSTPASTLVALYAKADGLLYSKDDAGTETLVSGGVATGIPATIFDAAGDIIVASAADTAARLAKGAAGGALSMINAAVAWNSGTSNPGSAVTGDRYWRTDLGLEIYFDGTRWLTTTLYHQPIGTAVNISAGTTWHGAVWTDAHDMWLVDLRTVMYAASGLSGTAFWRIDLYTPDAGTLGSVIAAASLISGTNATYTRIVTAIGALIGTGKDAFVADVVKVSTPGNFYGGASVTYRLVVA